MTSVRCRRSRAIAGCACGLLGHRHLLEVLGAQHFVGRGREGGIDLERRPASARAGSGVSCLVEHRLGQAAEARLLGLLVGRRA